MPRVHFPIEAPQEAGYQDSALSPKALMALSRNMTLGRRLPTRRRGYVVRRQQGSSAAYTERIPADELDGTQHAAFLLGADLYEDKASPSLLETLSVDPWAADTSPLPSWAYAYARAVLVNGTDFRVLVGAGGSLVSKPTLPDPAAPGLAAQAGGSMTGGTWYVRIRWYDQDTGTYSGPDSRLSTAGSVGLGAGNNKIQVTRPAAPTRASHWQIQLAMTTDTPSGYEITYETHTSGLIPKATSSVTLTQDPSSGTRFQFRTNGVTTVYRHSNPPAAHFVCFHRGRWFYGARDDLWVVWSDVGNPEHFFHDTTDPGSGFNSALGDGIGNSLSGPLTGIFSNQFQIFFAQRSDLHVGEGSWVEVFDENGVFIQRNARISPLSANGAGAVSSRWIGVDMDVYFISPRGPAVIRNGIVQVLDPNAIQTIWTSRAREVEHRCHVAYDPEDDLVLFSLATQATGLKRPDLVLAWSRSRQQWCPPFTLRTASLGLMRYQTDAGVDRGLRAMAGSWGGGQLELGVGDGDGWDGSDAGAAGFLPDSATTTSATKTGAGWTVNGFCGYSVVIVDPYGTWYYRQIVSNTADTITWEEAISAMETNHYVFIGGIPEVWHTVVSHQEELELRGVKLVLDDQPSRVGA